ncbi:hypothetical protein V1520DRAFT_198833 [Lipomyces starkeyi]
MPYRSDRHDAIVYSLNFTFIPGVDRAAIADKAKPLHLYWLQVPESWAAGALMSTPGATCSSRSSRLCSCSRTTSTLTSTSTITLRPLAGRCNTIVFPPTVREKKRRRTGSTGTCFMSASAPTTRKTTAWISRIFTRTHT